MGFATTILSGLLSITVRSSVLAALAALALLLFRVKSAAARHAVYTVLAGSMLFLAVLQPLLPPLAMPVLRVTAQPAAPLFAAVPAQVSRRAAAPAASGHVAPSHFWPSWQQAATATYALGALILLVRLLFGYLFTRRLVRGARRMDLPVGGEILESTWISVPLTVGWLRPRVILPAGWEEWDGPKLKAVLAHEGNHIRRADWAIAVMAGLNRSVFWFHPLAWWLERRLAFLAEQACDDAALLEVGTDSYASALLDMAAAVRTGQGRLVWEAMAMANVAEVKHRIERILDETRQIPRALTRPRWVALVAGSLPLIYVASVLQLVPVRAQQQPQAPPELADLLRGGRQLGPADVAPMERYLATNPHDLDARAQLIVYYYSTGTREPRLSHIYWLIANHPQSNQAVMASKGITPQTSAYNDATDYARAAGLWKQQAAAHSDDSRVLANAAEFLSQPGGDPNEAERLLIKARQMEPFNTEWRSRLARLYSVAIVGSAGDPAYPNTDAAFAERIKRELENSTDGEALVLTGKMLTAVAARPQPGERLPQGVLSLDEHPMLTPVVEMGQRLIERARQFGVVEGVIGSVPSSNGITVLRSAPGVIGSVPSTAAPQTSTQPQMVATNNRAPSTAPPLASAPPLLSKVDPVYPALARQARISGDVRIILTIQPDGHVQYIQIVSGHPLLVPATLDAVKQWVYAPIPSAGTLAVTVPFRIDGGTEPLGNSSTMQALAQYGKPTITEHPLKVRIGGAVQQAKLTSKVDPVYPEAARASGVEGDVTLDITIAEDGHVQSALPKAGHPLLVPAAVDAVKQWVYQQTLLNGQPITVLTTVTVPFSLH